MLHIAVKFFNVYFLNKHFYLLLSLGILLLTCYLVDRWRNVSVYHLPRIPSGTLTSQVGVCSSDSFCY